MGLLMFKRLAFVFLLLPSLAISADYTYVQNNFTAGELSPKIYQGRSDIEKYYTGAKTLLNYVPLPQGGITRRPGFEYVATAKTSTGIVKLIPFVFSPDQAYILEATDGTFRFFANGGQLTASAAGDGLLLHMDGSNYGTTFTDSGNTGHAVTANGDVVTLTYSKKFGTASAYLFNDDAYLSISDHADFSLTGDFTLEAFVYPRIGGSTSTMSIYYQETGSNDDSVSFYLYSDDGGSTWSVWFVVKESGSTVVSLNSGATTISQGTYSHVMVQCDTNYYTMAVNGIGVAGNTDTDHPANYTGDVLIGSTQEVAGADDFYGNIDELRLLNGAAVFTAPFTPPSAPYSGTGDIYEVANGITEANLPSLDWAQSYDTMYFAGRGFAPRKLTRSDHVDWSAAAVSLTASPWGSGNYPGSAAFHQDRLFYGGSNQYPARIWASQLGSYDDMTTGTDDDDGFVINLLSNESESIQWLRSMRKLMVGTNSSVFALSGGDFQDAITPGNRVAYRNFYEGVADVQPVLVNNSLIFVQADEKKLRRLEAAKYTYESNSYQATDLTILSDHLMATAGVKETAYQASPYNILWCVLTDGSLISLTYLPEHEVVAWARHESADGEFLSVATIPNVNGYDEVWVAVRRLVNESYVTYIERMARFEDYTDIADAKYLDSFLEYEGGGVSSVSGMSHLEGETVYAYRSYDWVSDEVESGAVSLQAPGQIGYTFTKAIVGLPYNSDFESVYPVPKNQAGDLGLLTTKRLTNLSLFARGSYGGQYGVSSSSLYDFITQTTTASGITGLVADKTLSGAYTRIPSVFIRQNEPYPMNIDAIMVEMDLGD